MSKENLLACILPWTIYTSNFEYGGTAVNSHSDSDSLQTACSHVAFIHCLLFVFAHDSENIHLNTITHSQKPMSHPIGSLLKTNLWLQNGVKMVATMNNAHTCKYVGEEWFKCITCYEVIWYDHTFTESLNCARKCGRLLNNYVRIYGNLNRRLTKYIWSNNGL